MQHCGEWIDLGGVEFCVITGGKFRLDGGGIFGVIPKPLWERYLPSDDRNRVLLETNCILARSEGQLVLIETGNGHKMDAKNTEIFGLEPDVSIKSSVQKAGLDPDAVDWLILTHLHMDHCGGASEWDEKGVPQLCFPKAHIVIQRGEWEAARANRSTMTATYRPENLDPLDNHLLLNLLNGDQEILPGISVEVMPGHTQNLQIVHLHGRSGHAVFASDVIPTWSHLRAPYNSSYDLSSYQNMQSKLCLLEKARAGEWLVITSHDPYNAVGRVEEVAANHYRLKPVPAGNKV